MPGPRLQANVSNAQPIVTSFSNAGEMQGIAQLGKIGASIATEIQTGNDDEVLAGVANDLQKITDQLDQGLITSKQANTMSNVVRNDAIQGSDHLIAEINSFANFNARSFQFAVSSETAQAKQVAAVADARIEDLQSAGINQEDPNADALLSHWRKLNQDYALGEQQLQTMELHKSIGKIQVEDVAFKHSQTLSTSRINKWNTAVGTDRGAFEAFDERTISRMKTSIESDLLSAESIMLNKYGDRLSNEEIGEMLTPIRNEAAFQLKLLNDTNFYETFQKRKQLRDLQADYILNPTAEAKALSTLTDKIVNSRDSKLFLDMVSNTNTMELVKGNMGLIMSKLSGNDKYQGMNAMAVIQDTKARSQATANMITSFTTQKVDLDDETAGSMANILANLTAPMDLNPNDYGIEAWDALMEYSASDNGKAMMSNPKFTAARTTINNGIANYSDKLMTSAIKNLPDNVTTSVAGGVLTLIAGTPDKSSSGRGVFAQKSKLQREMETWRQNYGERINTLAQAISNTSEDGDADAAINNLAGAYGLIDSLPNTNEPTDAEKSAAETAVNQGWFPDIESALAGFTANA